MPWTETTRTQYRRIRRSSATSTAGFMAGILDSQSVKTTESGGPKSYDAGKKVSGRKRHIVTDTRGSWWAC